LKVTFLDSAGPKPLSKHHDSQNGFSPYPLAKTFTSTEHFIDPVDAPLQTLQELIIHHGNLGHCLLKGDLKKPLVNEPRRGQTNKAAYSSMLVLDVDGISLPRFQNTGQYTKKDIEYMAVEILRELDPVLSGVSFIAQASSSLGLKGDLISMHIFVLLRVPVPPKALKLWLQAKNFASELFSDQISLTANGHTLTYPLDPCFADNSRLIFIAPPTFSDTKNDPFESPSDRIVMVNRAQETLDFTALMADISPELLRVKSHDKKGELRRAKGFRAKQEKLAVVNIGQRSEELLENPDRLSISVYSTDNLPYVQCDVNGGDSHGYYFMLNDPTYMYNFKGEPIWSIEKADPEFYRHLFDHFEDEYEEIGGGANTFPVVARDFYTDTVYNGVFDPGLNQFTAQYPLVPTGPSSVEGFMKSHGRAKPDFIPDARIVFDPCSDAPAVNLKELPYYINMFRKSDYLMSPELPSVPFSLGDSDRLQQLCPTIYALLKHILGGGTVELEHFVNWLSYVFQTRRKTMSAWVLQGVEGTGKGLFYTKILRPLFGEEHVPMRALQNIEEQFNLYMRTALFLVVDEFHMASASAGTIKIADKLKNQITENTVTIRAMRSNQHEIPNYTNFIFLTNRFDAVKLEAGDRRYNIAPRQEVKLVDAHPEVIRNIDLIDNELRTFAGVLQTFKTDTRLVRTPISNEAKTSMTEVTMSVFEEFCNAVTKGNLPFFLDVLDIQTLIVMQSGEISTAQRIVKTWLAAPSEDATVIPMEHLRIVYHVLSEERVAPRAFSKRASRNGLKVERKRIANDVNPIRGVVTHWRIDDAHKAEVIRRTFTPDDESVLLTTIQKAS
jgi:hypothetical protein